ncbi:MAG: radical SAM protein [Bacillota bacterium]|nr:MAG: radical SAM protein [Bacillota bacterium]
MDILPLASKTLPTNKSEMVERGWDILDFILITGDAYVDHPSFGAAIIGRVLESAGFRVGIIAQPDWRNIASFRSLGRPLLGMLVTAGNLDSMVSNYTAAGKPRREDDFSPGNIGGRRPDRAAIVYANKAREAWPGLPVILGGIEASLRRLAHYDYSSDKIRRSVLLDSKADLVLYGMAEFAMLEVASRLKEGKADFSDIRGACYLSLTPPVNALVLPSFEEIAEDKLKFGRAFKLAYLEQDPFAGKTVYQRHADTYVCVNPPAWPLTTEQMDWIYGLPFTRQPHPKYAEMGGVKAIEEIEFSITSHRGCFGSCSFCALTSHQGRLIQRRSLDSILAEARLLTILPHFKGYIHDIGGPTANFHVAACSKQTEHGACKGKACLSPSPCKLLKSDHSEYLDILRAVRALPGVKRVFVRSGVRYDYAMLDDNDAFLMELCQHHVSGQLKVAPEHVSSRVLRLMGKPPKEIYDRFIDRYQGLNDKLGKKQFVVPYFMSSHPGSTIEDAIELAEYLRDHRIRPQQVQDFIPTPGSLSTCMYYTGIHPLTGEKVHIPCSAQEKNAQRAMLQYFLPKNYESVYDTLTKAGRTDLIGNGPQALIPPRRTSIRTRSLQKR